MSEIQPSLGELEDAQNTAYENFFTARDAVTAAGERVAAADEAVCLAEKKYMHKWLRQRQMRTLKLRQRGRRRQRKRWRPTNRNFVTAV